MTPKHEHLIREIIYSGRLILSRSEGRSDVDYLADVGLRALVERKVEIIGEDLIRLRDAEPTLFRRLTGADRLIGLRNLIAYDEEDYPRDRLWRDAVALLPAVLTDADRLLTTAGSPGP